MSEGDSRFLLGIRCNPFYRASCAPVASAFGAMTSRPAVARDVTFQETAKLLYTTEIGQHFRFLNGNIAPAGCLTRGL